MLGTCPTIATTTSLFNSFAMGVATMFVLIFSNLFISLLRRVIPDRVRIPCYIVIISTFVIIVQRVMNRFYPDLYSAIGTFIDLIVVNCIILARRRATPPATSRCTACWTAFRWGWASPARCA